jgi:hypothetical protein
MKEMKKIIKKKRIMANHMRTNLTIEGSKKLMEFLEEKGKVVDERNKEDQYLAFVGAFIPEMKNDRGWFTDNVGAKWCYHEDFYNDDSIAEVILISAWYYPNTLIENLFKICSEIDEDVQIYGTFEDESYNPVGGFAINKYGFEEDEECDLEYPDEDVYLDADGEVDYDEYDVAMEEFYEEVYETKDLCQQNCLDVLNELKEEATT